VALVLAGALALVLVRDAAAREPPRVRVGVVVGAAELALAASAGDLVVEAPGAGAAAHAVASPRLRFGLRAAGEAVRPPSIFHVRVGDETRAEDAERLRAGLAGALDVPLHVEPLRGHHVVLAGPLSERGSAEEVAARLRAAGVAKVEVLEERPPAPPPSPRLVVVTEAFDLVALPADRVVVRPAREGALIELDGHAYRGAVEVLVTDRGRLNAVSVVDLETYLRGVVPEELGPDVYAEPEALAAQAVAARTYAIEQLDSGRHAGEGHDLCATAHCQVYGGASSEHPLSDAAVKRTAGRVLTFEGELARTFFSSTCGGHTDAVELIFTEQPARPYLAGVPCSPASLDFHEVRGMRLDADWALAAGSAAHDVLARLVAVGVVDAHDGLAGGFRRRARASETLRWAERAAAVTGRRLPEGAAARADAGSAIALVAWLGEALGWADRLRFVSPADRAAAARFRSLDGMPESQVASALVALQAGTLPEGLEPGWAFASPSRGLVLEVLALWLERQGAFDAPPERFAGVGEDGALLLFRGPDRRPVRVGAGTLLLSGRRDRPPAPRASLALKVGDRLRLLPPGSPEPRYVAVEEDADGAAFDRISAHAWWSRRTDWADVARRARERHGVDGLAALEVSRRSPAGRIVGVRLTGADGGTTEVAGFAVRSLLDLPDLMAAVSVERDAEDRPLRVAAVGRGWGHGVGLCQVGAWGQALLGARAEDILAHYYPGTELVDLSTLP
jgi:stage II sporulation protein D